MTFHIFQNNFFSGSTFIRTNRLSFIVSAPYKMHFLDECYKKDTGASCEIHASAPFIFSYRMVLTFLIFIYTFFIFPKKIVVRFSLIREQQVPYAFYGSRRFTIFLLAKSQK